MYLSHKSNVVQQVHETEWQCRRLTKRLNKSEYWAWLDSVTTVTGDSPDEVKTIDYSGETGYTIVECTDEDVETRLGQLNDYITSVPTVYNIKYYATKRDSEIVDVEAHTIPAHKDEDGNDVAEEDVATTYVQTHFIGDDSAKDARLLSEEWKLIRQERDRLLAETDWMVLSDTGTISTAWKNYRKSLRDLPSDQSSKTTYTDITWPSKP